MLAKNPYGNKIGSGYIIAERISVRQIIVQHTRHWAVCMYVCIYIYVRKKFWIET